LPGTPIGGSPSGFLPGSATARQAEINARMGPGYSGPQYGGAGLGAQNPMAPAGYTQVGNRYLSPGMLALEQRNRVMNDPVINAEMDRLTLMPDSVKKYALINNYRNQLAQQHPGAYNPTGRTNEQAARAQWNQGSGVRKAEYMEARRLAEEKYYRDRAEKMRQAQAGPGFSLGNLAQAFNPFKGVTRIAEGQGRPQDYLKIASMFL
jgi:hypothetical protein